MTADDRAKRLEQLPDWEWAATHDDRWVQSYEELLAYVTKHGRLPQRSLGALGRWVDYQRTAYKGKDKAKMTPDRIQLLEAVPKWTWGTSRGDLWSQRYEELVVYVAEHKQLPLRSSVHLGNWINNQQTAYREQGKKKITQRRIHLLEQVPGWTWDWAKSWDERWDDLFSELAELSEKRGSMPLPSKLPKHLTHFVHAQRKGARGTAASKVTPERRALLESIPGWEWDSSVVPWEQRHAEYMDHVSDSGGLPLQDSVLGRWGDTQRTAYKEGKLSSERIAMVEAIPGWYWVALDKWYARGHEYVDAVAREGRLPSRNGSEASLNVWGREQVAKFRRGQLDEHQAAFLKARVPELKLERTRVTAQGRLRELVGYLESHNGDLPPVRHPLRIWMTNQKSQYRRDPEAYPSDLKATLEAIPGWEWDRSAAWVASWMATLQECEDFVTENGCDPTYKTNKRLAVWMAKQRLYGNGAANDRTLSADRRAALDAWDHWHW